MPPAEPLLLLLSALDWRLPWFAHYRGLGEKVAAFCASGLRAADALNQCSDFVSPMHFVEAGRLRAGCAYESFIDATRSVPTRDNLHDLFNGLVWLRFPLSKRRLNGLQADAIRADGIGAKRGLLRDAITVFDENGALLAAPEPLLAALAARDWRRLFVELRPLWREAHLVPFGHALLEKLVQPRKAICAHVLALPIGDARPDELDAALAAALCAPGLAGKPFLPLPVLGVPGWWAENENPAFYDDAAVFRTRHQPRGGSAAGLNLRVAPASVAARPSRPIFPDGALIE